MEWLIILGALALLGGKKSPPAASQPNPAIPFDPASNLVIRYECIPNMTGQVDPSCSLDDIRIAQRYADKHGIIQD